MDSDLQWTRDRDPIHLRAAYFEYATPDRAREQLAAYAEHTRALQALWQHQIDEIDAGTSATLNRRLQGLPPERRARATAFKRYTYEGMVQRASAQIDWAERGLALLDELER